MLNFPVALAAFVLLHVGVSATGLRGVIVRRIGENAFRGLFSLATAIVLGWMIFSFAAMRDDPANPYNQMLWTPPDWARHVTHLFVLLGFLLAIPGVFTPGPTYVGFENSVKKGDAARGMLRITRHPFLWGVAFWAAGHLLVNGERFAPMLFGALGVMVLYGTRSIDRKMAARDPENWARFAAATSNIPFAAILQGRNQLKIGEIGWRLLLAVLVFALVGAFHRLLFSVQAFSISL